MKSARDPHLGERPYASSCSVRKAGYEWVEDLASDRVECVRYHPDQRENHHLPLSALDAQKAGAFEPPFLWARRPSTDAERGSRRYDPMRRAGLHRHFANVPSTLDGVKRFANRFGMLGHHKWYAQDLRTEELGDAETFANWKEEIEKMRTLVEIFDLSRSRGQDAERRLRTTIETRRRGGRFLREKWLETHPEYVESLPYVWAPRVGASRDPFVLARAYVLAHVNERLREWTSPVVGVDEETGMSIAPANLLGALYLHFAHETIGRTRPPIQCPGCMRLFEPEHGLSVHCSSACRQRAYLARKKEQSREGDEIVG